MSSVVTQFISDVFTVDHLIYFTAGLGTSLMYHTVAARFKGKEPNVTMRLVIMAMSVIVLAYVTISTYQANQCIVQFNTILSARSAINGEDQRISLDQRREFYSLIHDIVFPPPAIAQLESDDPVRQQYVVQRFIDTDQELSKGFAQQADNENQRATHPLPTPSCN